MTPDITPVSLKPNLRKKWQNIEPLRIKDIPGTMLPMEQSANFLALHSRLNIIWPQMPSQLPLPLTTSLMSAGTLFFSLSSEWAMHFRESEPPPIMFPRPGMAWNALLLCSSRSHSTFQVESDTISVRKDLTFLARPVDFYGCLHNVYFILPYIFVGYLCFSPL